MDGKLYRGDCLKILPTLESGSVDAVVTSPPYAMQRKTTYGGIPEAEYPAWTVSWLEALRPALTPRGSVLINIREHKARDGISDYVHRTRLAVRAAGWYEIEELIWVKPTAPPAGAIWLPRRSWERVLWFAPSRRPWCDPVDRSRALGAMDYSSMRLWQQRCGLPIKRHSTQPKHPRFRDWLSAGSGNERFDWHHPARFPTLLATWLVGLICPPGGLCLDPFMGSGTTGVACLQTGRRFIGIEQDAGYCAIARKRLRQAERELRARAAA